MADLTITVTDAQETRIKAALGAGVDGTWTPASSIRSIFAILGLSTQEERDQVLLWRNEEKPESDLDLLISDSSDSLLAFADTKTAEGMNAELE